MMQRFVLLTIIAGLTFALTTSGQEGPAAGRALGIPSKKFGISIGNSLEFTGVRINFADRDVRQINGINLTFWADNYKSWLRENQYYKSVINGFSVGVMTTAGTMRGVNTGLIRVATSKNQSGLSAGVLNVFANGEINGISVSGFLTQCNSLSGLAFAGIAVGASGGINGVAISGLAVSSDRSDLSGVAASLGVIYCGGEFNGVGVSGLYLNSSSFKGLAVSGFARTSQMTGISIAIFNWSNVLNGLQFGLLNYAGNNRKGFRLLPVMNIHIGEN
jgi:hypothetical protein